MSRVVISTIRADQPSSEILGTALLIVSQRVLGSFLAVVPSVALDEVDDSGDRSLQGTVCKTGFTSNARKKNSELGLQIPFWR